MLFHTKVLTIVKMIFCLYQVDKRRWGWAGQDTGHKPSTQSAGRIQQVGYYYQDG